MSKIKINDIPKLAKVLKSMGIKEMTNSNIELIKEVSPSFDDFKIDKPTFRETKYSREELIWTGLSTLEMYGPEYSELLANIFNNRFLKLMNEPYNFSTSISFSKDNKEGKVIGFRIPKISTFSDIIWYAHEGIHVCKDIHYDEYTNSFRYGDVITFLHELIISQQLNEEILYEWFNARFYCIKESATKSKEYIDSKSKTKSQEKKEIYNTLISSTGRYILSYYYALILYDIYLTNPRAITREVTKVLNGEQTTEKMLNYFNILNINDDLLNRFVSMNDTFKYYKKR